MRSRHPLSALLRPLRGYSGRATQRADAEAIGAGLTVEVLPGGVHRYRDPRLDQLATHRASTAPAAIDAHWSQLRLVVSVGWSR
jgi:hypothetical protein